MVTLAILFILFVGAYSGYRNGLITTLIRTIGYTFTLMLALDYYQAVSEYIYLIVPYPSPFFPVDNPYHYYDMEMIFTLDQSYYYLISFALILLLGWMVTRFLSELLSYYTSAIIVPELFNQAGGAVLGFMIHYFAVFLLLLILSTIPYSMIQNRLAESTLADGILTATPRLSEAAYQRFIQDVHEEEMEKQPLMELEDLKEKNAEETEADNE